MRDVLILSKSLEAPGGIANFIRSVVRHLPAEIRAQHLPIGRSPGHEGNPTTWIAPIRDNFRLVRAVRHLNPACVHVNPSFNWPSLLRDGAFLFVLQALGHGRTLAFFHGWDPATADRVARSAALSWLVRSALRDVPVICVLASSFKRTLTQIGVPESRIQVVTTMYDPAIFHGIGRRRSDRVPEVLFLGRLVAEKGAGDVLEAFAELFSEGPRARLMIAGEGPDAERLEARAAELNLASHVHFPGYLSGRAKGQALLNADLFVFPTRYGEGCPVSLLEAMAAGLPIITTRAGGIPDIFEDEVNGVLLSENKPAELKAAMTRVLTDRAWARDCGSRNRAAAEQSYTPESVVGNLTRLYHRAAATA